MTLSIRRGFPLRGRPAKRNPKPDRRGTAWLLCLIGGLGLAGCLSLPPEPRFTDAEIDALAKSIGTPIPFRTAFGLSLDGGKPGTVPGESRSFSVPPNWRRAGEDLYRAVSRIGLFRDSFWLKPSKALPRDFLRSAREGEADILILLEPRRCRVTYEGRNALWWPNLLLWTLLWFPATLVPDEVFSAEVEFRLRLFDVRSEKELESYILRSKTERWLDDFSRGYTPLGTVLLPLGLGEENYLQASRMVVPLALQEAKGKVLECLLGDLRRTTQAPDFSRRITPEKRRRFALIVGIDRYRDPRIARLRFARKDALAMADIQEGALSAEDEVHHTVVLLGEEATRAKIRETLDGFARLGVREKDSVLFYFSGFGTVVGGPDGTEPVLVTHDASRSDPAKTGMTLSGIAKQLGSWKAESITVILDTSFSREKGGKSLGGTVPRDWTEKQLSNTFGERIATLAAGGSSGRAFELEAFGHGVMTYCIRDGLGGEADRDGDGSITRKELGDFLSERVPFFSRMVGLHQKPSIRFPKGGSPFRVKTR